MNQTLSTLNMLLKSFNRNSLPAKPMTLDDLYLIDGAREPVNEKPNVAKPKNLIVGKNVNTFNATIFNPVSLKHKTNPSLFLTEDMKTIHFRHQVDTTAGRFNSVLGLAGKTGLVLKSVCDHINTKIIQ